MTADNNEEREAVDGFCTELLNLKENNKVAINLLTLMAEDYKLYSNAIVDAIEKILFETRPERKIIILYVIDSIIKNLKQEDGNYRKLFEKKIVDMIVHVFKEISPSMRGQLFKLRTTWDDKIFLKSKLFAIDTKINDIDKAWVINSLRPSGAEQPPATDKQPSGNLVHVNPKFLEKTNNDTKKSSVEVKSEPIDSEINATDFSQKCLPSEPEGPPQDPSNIKDPRLRRKTPLQHQQRHVPLNEHHQRHGLVPGTIDFKRDPRLRTVKGSTSPPNKRLRSMQQPFMDISVQPQESKLPSVIKPTVAPGNHAFEPAALVHPVVEMKFQPQSLISTVTPLSVPIPTIAYAPPIASGGAAQNHLISQVPVTLPDMRMPPPTIPVMGVPQSVPMVNPQLGIHHIRDETPRISGLPENKKIFLDGKAYEVFYLDDQAVIERNGLPHRVSFTGPPREILIDKERYTLPFGPSIEVQIDGQRHTLRFGAPGRELYMDRYPFKGEFGSGRAPIVANVNGRRHEIRLIGAPPEVKIDPDPAHELARYMTTSYSRPQAPPQPKNEQVKELLKKLKQSGILTTEKRREEEARKERERQASLPKRPPSPDPIACDIRILNNIERRSSPSAPLEQFSMRIMHIRYDSVIEDLQRVRTVCQHCGIAIQDINSEANLNHANWHVMNSLQVKQLYARSNPWLMTEEWFCYSETELVNNCSSHIADSQESSTARKVVQITNSSNKDVLSTATEERSCSACNEGFAEYHDDEDDEWKLKDSVLKLKGSDFKLYHRQCLEDNAPRVENNEPEDPTTIDKDISLKMHTDLVFGENKIISPDIGADGCLSSSTF